MASLDVISFRYRMKIISNKRLRIAALDNNLLDLLKTVKLEPFLNFMPLKCKFPQDLEENIMAMEKDFQGCQKPQAQSR